MLQKKQTNDITNRLLKSCINLTWWRNEKVKHQLQDYEVNTTLKQKFKT